MESASIDTEPFVVSKPKILLLSYGIKAKLEKFTVSNDLVIDPASTDVEFLHIIREYLVESGKIHAFDVLIVERDDLHALNGSLRVEGAAQVQLVETPRVGYPSSIPASKRLERQFGDYSYYCPFELGKVVKWSKLIEPFVVNPIKDVIFEYSDDEPVQSKHFEAYEILCRLFKKGRVQTNPHFPFKKACASEYRFSSSKNIAYHLCGGLPIVIPGIITSDVEEAQEKLMEFKSVVLKVQDGTGGNGVLFFDKDDPRLVGKSPRKEFMKLFDVMLKKQNEEDRLLGVPKRGIVVQKFLPNIKEQGDTRVHIINGKVCLIAQKRVPKGSSKLANLSAGGTFETKILNDDEIEVAVQIAKKFQECTPSVNSSHIGIDLLRGKAKDDDLTVSPLLSEVNTWGIGLISPVIDFLMNHTESQGTARLYGEFQSKLLKLRGTKKEEYILQSENILEELVGRYLM